MTHRATRVALLCSVITATCLGTIGAAAQSPGPGASLSASPGTSPAAVDMLAAGLLQFEDLPAGMVPATEVQDGTDYDIDDPAFVANDGTRIVSRTWGLESTDGTSIVFDFRMQFPTPEAASAYLAAALPTLSESQTTGLRPLTAVPAMGDETYAFGLDTQGESGPVTVRTYLFRVGSVVAKVLGGGVVLTGDQVEAIAQAAAARVVAAGEPVAGSPRPEPTPSPAASALPLPSGDLTALLLAHVPDAIAPACTPDSQRLWEGELVTLACSLPDVDVVVTYSGFDTADHMGAAYQSGLDSIDLSDLADGCDVGTYAGTYQLDGQDVGQIVCWAEPNGQAIMWSDDRLSILSVAVSPSLDASSLYTWWMEAGPRP